GEGRQRPAKPEEETVLVDLTEELEPRLGPILQDTSTSPTETETEVIEPLSPRIADPDEDAKRPRFHQAMRSRTRTKPVDPDFSDEALLREYAWDTADNGEGKTDPESGAHASRVD